MTDTRLDTTDPVNPSHYKTGSVEAIEAMQACMSGDAFKGYCKGNALKYLWRYENKGGVEDLRKAQWYLQRLIGFIEQSEGADHAD